MKSQFLFNIFAYHGFSFYLGIIALVVIVLAIYNKKRKRKIVPQKMDNSRFSIVKFKSPLPFEANEKQVIYVEDKYNRELNQFINKNYSKIKNLFSSRGCDFAYIPLTQYNIEKDSIDLIRYNYPTIPFRFMNREYQEYQENRIRTIIPQNIYNALFSFFFDEREPLKPGFIQYKSQTNNAYTFSYFPIQFTSENDLWEQIYSYLQSIEDGSDVCLKEEFRSYKEKHSTHWNVAVGDIVKEKTIEPPPTPPKTTMKLEKKAADYSYRGRDVLFGYSNQDQADYDFPEEAFHVINEIQTRISYLTHLGINEWVLRQLFTLDATPKLSKLLITKDFEIILPDYNYLMIHLTPLPKAVFLLFLKHPEGILFKNLQDYKEELMNIYLILSNRESIETMEKSIDDLVDSTKNAINEKCSRIREAFIKEFDERLAENYFITGERYSPKRIKLNRDLVSWETEI